MNLCILIPLVVGLISAFLGYLLGKQGRNNETIEDNGDLKIRISDLEKELADCKAGGKSVQMDLGTSENENVASNLTSNLKKVGAIDDSREYKLRLRVAELEEDLASYKKSSETLQGDLKECTKACESLEKKLKQAITANAGTEEIAFDAIAAKTVYGKKIKQDDLTLIEGIGPKIQELFHNHGVKTWKELSECSVEKCQEVLDSGGDRYRMHSPNTWPKQAKLAYEGAWQELSDWQDELDGGKES